MNANKARDFFSSYYEGTLDGGLKAAFERQLNTDAQIGAEYRAFERVMRDLEVLKDSPIDLPNNLHERIAARLDNHLWEQKRKAPVGIGVWWRSLALGGVAALAIVGAIASLTKSGGTGSGANLIGSGGETVASLEYDGTTVSLLFSGSGEVLVRTGVDGPVTQRISLDGRRLRSKLQNSNENASILTIEVGSNLKPIRVALPGSKPITASAGQGTTIDLSMQIAAFYNKPVEIMTDNLTLPVSWKFSGDDPTGAQISVGPGARGLAVTLGQSGVYRLNSQ